MKERYQNPVIGDEIRLRLMAYNSNNLANVDAIEKVEIYFLDPEEITETNLDGRRLVTTIESDDITTIDVGLYSVLVTAEVDIFTIGNYIDVWSVTFGEETALIENDFAIYPNLWLTTTQPIIYDFNFAFRPNRIRAGSKRWLTVEISPNVPSQKELIAYYQNLAITGDIKISIEQHCGECVPVEEDLRLIVEDAAVELREKCLGFYHLDTTEDGLDMKEGIYNVWFELTVGDSVYISEKQQLQIV